MKKLTTLILAIVMMAAFTGCGSRINKELEEIYNSTELTVENIPDEMKEKIVFISNSKYISGKNNWDTFCKTAESGKACAVVLVKDEHIRNVYKNGFENYTYLLERFCYLIEFDGAEYSAKVRRTYEDDDCFSGKYKYLVHLEGESTYDGDLPYSYDRFILANNKGLTWEDIREENEEAKSPLDYYSSFMKLYEDIQLKN